MKMRELESKSFTIWRSNEKKMKIKGKRDGRSLGPPHVYIQDSACVWFGFSSHVTDGDFISYT